MDAQLDHRLAWIFAAALVGSAACGGGGPGETSTSGAAGGRDGGAKNIAACLGPSWFGGAGAMKDDACRTKTIDLVRGKVGASKGPGARPLAKAKENGSCKGVFVVKSDADIQGILAAVDDGQLAMAKLAAQNGSSQAVKDSAAQMDHRAHRQPRPPPLPSSRSPAQHAQLAPAHKKAPVRKAPARTDTSGGG